MQKYNCKECGAELYWDPESSSLKCEYCESSYQPSDFKDLTIQEGEIIEIEEIDIENTDIDYSKGMVVYKCSHCGAEVIASETTMATICAYCGRAVSITQKSVGEFRPHKLIPFKIEKNKAIEIYKKYTKSSWLIPKNFKNENTINKIQGLYTPFWLHSMKANALTELNCENKASRKSGNDKITTHNLYEVKINAYGDYKYIPVDASIKLDNKLMDALEPFDYEQIKEYNPAYMAGYIAEQADEKSDETKKRATDKIDDSLKEKAIENAGVWDSKIVSTHNVSYTNEISEYAMLPIWILSVEYNGEIYTYAINGQTGKSTGRLPIDIKKIILSSVGIFFALPLISFLISFILLL